MPNYEGLTAVQQNHFDTLMTKPISQWPPELIGWARNYGGPFCGDALAEAVASWVRVQASI